MHESVRSKIDVQRDARNVKFGKMTRSEETGLNIRRNWTGQGVQRSKHPLFQSRIHCKGSLETYPEFGYKVEVRNESSSETRSQPYIIVVCVVTFDILLV